MTRYSLATHPTAAVYWSMYTINSVDYVYTYLVALVLGEGRRYLIVTKQFCHRWTHYRIHARAERQYVGTGFRGTGLGVKSISTVLIEAGPSCIQTPGVPRAGSLQGKPNYTTLLVEVVIIVGTGNLCTVAFAGNLKETPQGIYRLVPGSMCSYRYHVYSGNECPTVYAVLPGTGNLVQYSSISYR